MKASRGLPPLFFVTDPLRTPQPEEIAARLPQGCGVIYRHFGESEALSRARRLRAIADDRGLTLLIGEDVDLALEVGADGVHLRQASLGRLSQVHAAHPGLRLTAACHDLATLELIPVDSPLAAVFVSPVFASRSASAHGVVPLGVEGVRRFAAATALPVYGLGGITTATLESLAHSGLSGVAAVDAFLADERF